MEQTQQYMVCSEAPVAMQINGELLVTFMCTPNDLSDLALGHMLARGMIRMGTVPEQLAVEEETLTIRAKVKEVRAQYYTVPSFVLSGCSAVAAFSDEVFKLEGVGSNYAISLSRLVEISHRLVDEAVIYKNYGGGVHGCLICLDHGPCAHREDIGRHNAVDKSIGALATAGHKDFSQSVVASTGRISLDMVLKALSIGAPILTSLSIPSDLAVKLADRLGICIVGRMGSSSPLIYSNPQRVIVDI